MEWNVSNGTEGKVRKDVNQGWREGSNGRDGRKENGRLRKRKKDGKEGTERKKLKEGYQ
jgi:hypothetical protein